MNIENEDDVGAAGAPAGDEPALSLRETLAAEFAKANDVPDAEGEDPKPARARDDSGRFAGKPAPTGDDATAAPPAPAAAPDPAAAVADTSAAAPAPAVDVAAPGSWTAEAKAKWNDVPPDVRKYIAEREDQMHRALTRNDEERNLGRTMSQTLQPFAETMRSIGVSPDRAVAGLLNVDSVLRSGSPEQKLEMVHEIMRSYQIQPEAVFNHQPTPVHPQVQALQQQMQAMQQQMQQGSQQQQEALNERAAQAEIEAFKANAPHLEAVRDHMSQLLTSGIAKDLQDAYEQAVWANPQTRQAMQAQQTAASSKAQRVASARNAGSSISGAPGGVVPNQQSTKRSLREELAANFGDSKSRI